jgi:3D (Asp-Asp-Asp) domain-containing protein
MRKTMAVWTVVILGFMICWGAAGQAQEAEQVKPTGEGKAVAAPEKPVHAYRLDFSVRELEEGKTINTRQYSLNLNADDPNEIKIGTRVPVESGQGQYQYIDVGTSIWCRIGERPDGIPVSVKAEISNFAIPDHESGHPVIRQLKINASTLALLGKPMIIGSVDDPNSKRQFQLEVTVTKLK